MTAFHLVAKVHTPCKINCSCINNYFRKLFVRIFTASLRNHFYQFFVTNFIQEFFFYICSLIFLPLFLLLTSVLSWKLFSVLVILFSYIVSGSFLQQIQMTSNITLLPFLPNNEVATNYPALKLMTQIENDNRYESCLWYNGGRSLGTIFGSAVPCSNRTEPNFALTCDTTNNFVTATAAFLSPVQQEDGGLYQVLCRSFDFSEVIIAQISITVSGISLMAIFKF